MIKQFLLDKKISPSGFALLLLGAVLLFIFSVPHAMAGRKILLYLTFFMAIPIFWRAVRNNSKPLLHATLLLFALQLWMLIITFFIADQPYASLLEWKGQWLTVAMCYVIGIGIACTLMDSAIKAPRVAVTLIVIAPITLFLTLNAIAMLHEMVLAGKFLPNQLGITDEKGVTNYLIALMEPILIADMLGRLVKGIRLIPVPNWVISLLLALALFSLFAASSRNGLIIMMLAFMLGAAMMVSESRKKFSPLKVIGSALATLLLVFTISFISYKTDPRWATFVETIPIAWDIDRDLRWLDSSATDVPVTASGKSVDISEYYRIAWAHAGLRMLAEHPWGMEISRETFRNLELEKYGQAKIFHSHNAWIDFGLNVGIPGLLLWAAFLLFLIKTGWSAWKSHQDQLGLALAIMVIMFMLRGLLDSTFRNQIIEQFMLTAALLLTTLLYKHRDN